MIHTNNSSALIRGNSPTSRHTACATAIQKQVCTTEDVSGNSSSSDQAYGLAAFFAASIVNTPFAVNHLSKSGYSTAK